MGLRYPMAEWSKDITSGFLTCSIMLVMDEFGFERVEEALHRTTDVEPTTSVHQFGGGSQR
jgi:hypothetical protein